MKKLFRVNIEFDTVIEAESSEEAERLAEGVIRDGDDPASSVTSSQINSVEDLPEEWEGSCYPWGGTGEYDIDAVLRGEHVN